MAIEPEGFNRTQELISAMTYAKAPEFTRMVRHPPPSAAGRVCLPVSCLASAACLCDCPCCFCLLAL